ncbi:hypothetical protein AB0E08_07950 [Streptomyces sp. NPDC048281]|uniref:DUF7297 family protein n=1 Tax=Streptomyces sp. NPDC048281 TaxID=3154715 RepID=UPI00342E02BE
MADDQLHQGDGTFGTAVISGGLIPLQADVTVPQSTQLASGTGMLVADTAVTEQLLHFPEEVYDLRPTSHLVRLMQALLGDSGVGQLRKRLLVSQMASLSTSGARFFDLDRFYGAIFNAARNDSEVLPINPMETATATASEWDSIESADASFRDRMGALAKSIAMGGTVPGLQAAAEAITGVEVDVYESWALLDAAGDTGETAHDWAWMEAGLWSDYEGEIWGALEGTPFYGRSGSLTRSEVLVRVNRDYPQTPDGRAQQASDESALVRVLERIKPAHMLLTVDTQGTSALVARGIAGVRADSESWEIVPQVTPTSVPTSTDPYPLSAIQQQNGVDPSSARVLPRPPMTTRLGDEWSYGQQVPTCRSYAVTPDSADFTTPGTVPDADLASDDQTVVWRDGTSTVYLASLGALDPLLSHAARAGGDGVLIANPYSGDRRTVLTTD